MRHALRFLPLLLLAACQPQGSPGEAPLAGSSLGGPFRLVRGDGTTVTDRDFAGRYRLMYFGYTFCPDVCPTSLAKLMAGYRDLARDHPEKAAKLQPIFVTVDPERDTPAIVQRYADTFDPHLLGLTGSPEVIAAVSREYGVGATKEEVEGSSEYLMTHSDLAILYDPDGEPLIAIDKGTDPGGREVTPQQIADQLATWIR